MPLEIQAADMDSVYRLYSTCKGDIRPWILDLRPQKDYKKGHLLRSYSVRLTADQQAVVDFSKNQYEVKWTPGCWWGKEVFAYGDSSLKKDHPVLQFLLRDGRAAGITIFREGFDHIIQQCPYLSTTSVKANAQKRPLPGQIVPGLLYLGDWDHASDPEQLAALKIKGIITIHNHPENLKPKATIKHVQIEAADVESYDISQNFSATFDFIEDARRGNYAVLVHCGAGVSRSATLCIAYLMRKNLWPLEKALDHCVRARSCVEPNDGFMECLKALEGALRLGGDAADERAAKGFAADIAGEKVVVKEESEGGRRGGAESRGDDRHRGDHREQDRGSRGERDDRYSRDHDRERRDYDRRDRDRDYDRRDRDRDYDRRDRDRDYDRRDRDRDYDRRDRDRDYDRRDRDYDQDRDRDYDRGEGRKRGRDDREDEAERERRVMRTASERGASPAEADEPPVLVLDVVKEGQVMSKLKIPALKSGQRVIFGRNPQCDIKLEHMSVSRQHAHIFQDDTGNVFIEDLATSHGTNVNDTWLRSKVPKALAVNSVIRFGASTRSYRVAEINASGSSK